MQIIGKFEIRRKRERERENIKLAARHCNESVRYKLNSVIRKIRGPNPHPTDAFRSKYSKVKLPTEIKWLVFLPSPLRSSACTIVRARGLRERQLLRLVCSWLTRRGSVTKRDERGGTYTESERRGRAIFRPVHWL